MLHITGDQLRALVAVWSVVECRICNREVAGSNLGRGYFAPRSTQPSIPLGSVNEYQLWLGRQRQVWLITTADERVGVQVKLCNPLRTRAIPERFCGGDSLRRGAMSSVYMHLYLLCTFVCMYLRLFARLRRNGLTEGIQIFGRCGIQPLKYTFRRKLDQHGREGMTVRIDVRNSFWATCHEL